MEAENNERTALVNRDVDGSKSFGGILSKFKLELAMMFVFLGWNLPAPIIPNILLRNTCLMYGFNVTICNNLNIDNSTKHIEEIIQPLVAEITMTTSLMHTFIPAVWSCFLGPWSDRFGRKKVICGCLLGASLSMISFVVVTIINKCFAVVNPWIYVLPNIPLILSGGWTSMVGAIFCYIADSSNKKDRSSRLIFFETTVFTAVLIATVSCTFLLEMTSPMTMFTISAVLIILASTFILLSVNESLPQPENISVKSQIGEIFSTKPLHQMLVTCLKPRPNNGRRIMWCLFLIIILTTAAMNGFENIFYLFVREKFQWNLRDLTFYNSSLIVFAIFGSFIGAAVFKKLLNISDIGLIFIAIISKLLDSLCKTFVENTLQMYVTSAIFLFKVLAPVMCKSLISTTANTNEIGRIFCIMGLIEAFANFVSSPVYTFVYSKTFTFFPSAFYLITCSIAFVNLMIAFYVKQMKNSQ
jgi:MFS transporter, PCFT/HCP family, solute carrier family 46 (folate transporter), member 1